MKIEYSVVGNCAPAFDEGFTISRRLDHGSIQIGEDGEVLRDGTGEGIALDGGGESLTRGGIANR